MEWFGPLRRHSYQIAGFSSLRNIRHYIEHTEPRVNPAVYPLANGSTAAVEGQRSLSRPPKGTSDISPLWHSAADYRQLFLSAEITPLDVVNAILPLIRRDTVPPGEHSTAWFDVKVDIVIEAAKASTARYREKKSLGPLDGVPTAIKEEFDMEGYITTMGSVNDYTGQKLNEKGNIDNWCVQKLKEAGAVIVGKLSMHEFGMDTSGNNILFGTPRNPYNQDYYTGGSSSGSAYAVATGLVPMALGSDGGGSIRIPASCCSVFGLKTTHARMCSLPGENHSNSVSVDGPIAADVQSLAAMYAVISQPHPTSPFTQAPMFQSLEQDGQRPKVLGLPEVWFRRAKPEIQSLCRSMMDWLVAHKGYTVVPIQIPFVAEGQTAHALTILTDAATLLPDPRGLSPGNRVLLALGREIPATDYLLAQKLRNVLMQHLSSLWQTHPGMVIVTPTTACAGWPIGSEAELRYGMSDGVRTKQTMEYVWLANLCGVPSITVPAGFVKAERSGRAGEVAGGKVPVGLMATGEWASEESLLQFGLDAEEAGVGLQRRPPTWVDVVHRAREGGDADEAP